MNRDSGTRKEPPDGEELPRVFIPILYGMVIYKSLRRRLTHRRKPGQNAT